MRQPAGETLRPDALRRWARVMDLRTLITGAIVVELIVFPTVPDHWRRTLVLELAFVAYSAFLGWRLRRVRRLEAWTPITDAVMVAAFALALPEAWPAFVAAEVTVVVFAVLVHGRAMGWLTIGVGTAALVVPATQATNGAVGVSSFALIGAMVAAGVGFARADEAGVADRYTALVNGIHGIVWEYDIAARVFTIMSDQVVDILGWTVEDASRPETWTERGGDVDPRQLIRDAIAGGHAETEFRVRHADGHTIWLHARTTADQRVARGILTDVTAQHEADLVLRQYAEMIEGMPLGAAVWQLDDPDDQSSLRLVGMNPAMASMTKLAQDSVGERLFDLFPDGRAVPLAQVMAGVVRTGVPQRLDALPYDHADGATGFYSSVLIPLPGNCLAILNEDITERHGAAEALRHQALHDSLTGLPNRALLQDRLSAAVATSRRTGAPLALLVMDLDQFKEVNDTLGHPMGDRLLRGVAGRLEAVLRDCDTVARLGGDEFAVLLTTDAAPAGARRVAERINAALAEPFDLDGMAVRTAASIGIAVSPDHGDDAGALVQHADVAMYAAKRSGQGYAFYASEDDHSSVRRLLLAADLHDAIAAGQLVLHFQPQEDLASGAITGVEALVRWAHPDLGLVPPSEFIPLAEVSGAIVPLTRWVLRAAIERAAALRDAGFSLVVSANVSGRNLYDPELATRIQDDLRDVGLPPELLLLELTESELVDDPSQVMTVLTLVADMGVRVAVDDFGTGWSSLSNLIRLPVEQIKIDRSFVARMTEHGDAGVIVRSIIDLGHNLGLDVVAEGMENDATRDALRALGCDQGQGYLLAKPMPADELLSWLAARRALVTSP